MANIHFADLQNNAAAASRKRQAEASKGTWIPLTPANLKSTPNLQGLVTDLQNAWEDTLAAFNTSLRAAGHVKPGQCVVLTRARGAFTIGIVEAREGSAAGAPALLFKDIAG